MKIMIPAIAWKELPLEERKRLSEMGFVVAYRYWDAPYIGPYSALAMEILEPIKKKITILKEAS